MARTNKAVSAVVSASLTPKAAIPAAPVKASAIPAAPVKVPEYLAYADDAGNQTTERTETSTQAFNGTKWVDLPKASTAEAPKAAKAAKAGPNPSDMIAAAITAAGGKLVRAGKQWDTDKTHMMWADVAFNGVRVAGNFSVKK